MSLPSSSSTSSPPPAKRARQPRLPLSSVLPSAPAGPGAYHHPQAPGQPSPLAVSLTPTQLQQFQQQGTIFTRNEYGLWACDGRLGNNQFLQQQLLHHQLYQYQSMPPGERVPYEDIANTQPRGHHQGLGLEMPAAGGVTISTAESSGRKRKRAKVPKDPNAPKRATTAFFYFAHEERPKVKEAHPEFKVTEISKELGTRWRNMDEQQKERFQEMASKDRKRYHEENEVYKSAAQGAPAQASEYGEEED